MPAIKEDRPSYVRFEKRPIEDRQLSIQNGHFTTIDVDFVIITPHGTSDEIPRVAKDWFEYLDRQIRSGRVRQDYVNYYRSCYDHWKKGEETPLQGTAIKEWPPISPSQISNCLAARVYTVEDLAGANEATLGMLGMGARELKQKAENWLRSSSEKGKMTEEISTLQVENKRLKSAQARMDKTIEQLRSEVASLLESRGQAPQAEPNESTEPSNQI